MSDHIKEDCYWYDYDVDMGARIPYCTCHKGTDPLESCEGCTEYHSKMKKTNADRIRAMTDEELARELYRGCGNRNDVECLFPAYYEEHGWDLPIPIEEEDKLCIKCWLDWLKSPVKEEQTVYDSLKTGLEQAVNGEYRTEVVIKEETE